MHRQSLEANKGKQEKKTLALKEKPSWTSMTSPFPETKTQNLALISPWSFFLLSSLLFLHFGKSAVQLSQRKPEPPARFYWFLLALPHWVPTTPEVMLFVWGSGVVPISVKKSPAGSYPDLEEDAGLFTPTSARPTPALWRDTFILCQEVNERTPRGKGGPHQ